MADDYEFNRVSKEYNEYVANLSVEELDKQMRQWYTAMKAEKASKPYKTLQSIPMPIMYQDYVTNDRFFYNFSPITNVVPGSNNYTLGAGKTFTNVPLDRHKVRQPILISPAKDLKNECIARIYFGDLINCAVAFIVATGKSTCIWLHESLKSNPYVKFQDVDSSGNAASMRFNIGGEDPTMKTGHCVRVSRDTRTGDQHLCLPADPTADKHIVWYKVETPNEWLGSRDDYEQAVFEPEYLAAGNHRDRVLRTYQQEGWEKLEVDGSLYFRKRR